MTLTTREILCALVSGLLSGLLMSLILRLTTKRPKKSCASDWPRLKRREDQPETTPDPHAPLVLAERPVHRIVRSPMLTQWDAEQVFRLQIESAAVGLVGGTLADWPALHKSLKHFGRELPLSTPASVLRGVCLRLLADMPDEEVKRDFLVSAL
jgi:hypothetical protein